MRPISKKPFTKIGLMEWLKVKALSSNPSTEKKKKSPFQCRTFEARAILSLASLLFDIAHLAHLLFGVYCGG
jgi:hypothetical protein